MTIVDSLERENPRTSSVDYDKGWDLDRSRDILESMLATDTVVCDDYRPAPIVDICIRR